MDDRTTPIASEKLLAYAMLIRGLQPSHKPAVLYQAFRCFCNSTATQPHDTDAYQCLAACWIAVGDAALAERVLRSAQHASPDPVLESAIAQLPAAQSTIEATVPPPWSGQYRPRMLLLTFPESDYQLDSMYDAFCRELGHENVVEVPWKPHLHGLDPEQAGSYPCVANWPGAPEPVEGLVAQLENGEFDLVVYADRLGLADSAIAEALLDAARDLPLVILDSWDDGIDMQPELLDRLNRDACLAYFKRERVRSLPYADNTIAFPFGYSDVLTPASIDTARTNPVFWTGKRLFGLRPLIVDHLRDRGLIPEPETLDQAAYQAALQRAHIGLSLSGFGFDTVRYWEVPAHGAMLLAERPPIEIPHDFEDGKTAVFFNDLAELETKLMHYLAHEEEAAAIAAAGHEHLKRYHTTSVRARQFLGHVEARLAR